MVPLCEPVRVLIADSTRMGSELLASALRRDSRFTIVGCTADWDGVVSFLPSRPQVAVMAADLGKPSGGLEAARTLTEQCPGTRIVMILGDGPPNRNLVVEAFQAGSRGVFTRGDSFTRMGRCIHSVAKGQVWATSEQLGYLLEALRNSTTPRFVGPDGLSLLSDREQDVLRYVIEGTGNRGIAKQMKLSEHTVKNHLYRIYNKLGISSRLEIMLAVISQRPAARDAYVAFHRGAEPKSDAQLFLWYLQQADYAPHAQYMLGRMYVEGRGTQPDERTGYMWLLLAEASATEVIAHCREVRKNVAARADMGHLAKAKREALKRWQARHPSEDRTPPSLSPDVEEVASEPIDGSVVAVP